MTDLILKHLDTHYGLDGWLTRLPGECDDNYACDAGADGRWLVKVSHLGEDPALLELQTVVIDYLVKTAPSVPIAALRKTIDGQPISRLTIDGTPRALRVFALLDGRPLARVPRHSAALLHDLGRHLGTIDAALCDMVGAAAERTFKWDLRQGLTFCLDHLEDIPEGEHRRLVSGYLARLSERADAWSGLRQSLIHGDANDYNVLVDTIPDGRQVVSGIVDFGDITRSYTLADPAICCVYVMFNKDAPLAAAAKVIAGYHEACAIPDGELDHLLDLIILRLCTSVCNSAVACTAAPEHEYLQISASDAWILLEKLRDVAVHDATAVFRAACTTPTLLERRRQVIGPSLGLAYRQPLTIVRGEGQWLIDDMGQRYLDCVNNVCHVGHCHPRVVEAARHQLGILNTNTRYLHDNLLEYAERLTATLPAPLEVCFMVNSGSEANELAMRLAQVATGGTDFVVLESGYHGCTRGTVDISGYKFDRAGGAGAPAHVWTAPLADRYRGPYGYDDHEAGPKYAALVDAAARRAMEAGRTIAGFIAETMPGCGGQIVPPAGYLEAAYDLIRAHGGLCIADEVQTGFGRVGTHLWSFETQNVVPDIVTMGKPIGNGHPMAAVVTTRAIAEAFDNGMEFFSTFGGNPVSCAIGLAVLAVIEQEGLQAHADQVGRHLLNRLAALQEVCPPIADVRGCGLFLGVELVLDRHTRAPAAEMATWVVNRAREHGVLLSTDGPLDNVIKIKPPLVITRADADHVCDVLLNALDRV